MQRLNDISKRSDVKGLIRRALEEDVGRGDATSLALVAPDRQVRGVILSREPCVLSGAVVSRAVFRTVSARIRATPCRPEGARVRRGEVVMELAGPARAVLAGERVALNFLQRMSGIATLTSQFAARAKPFGVRVLDTRKTTPTLRTLEKYAVRCGGGHNHRFGLHDRVLIKDNHRFLWRGDRARTLADAVRAARRRFPSLLVEVEVESESELRSVLEAEPDWVLLDNMPPSRLRRCVQICGGRCRVEASGGITLENVSAIARSGVDAVSIGALTHSAPAIDFSLELDTRGA